MSETRKLDKKIISRYDAATNERDMQRSLFSDAYRYILPNSNLFDVYGPKEKTPGKQKNIEVYDMTAALAARQFVSKMHSTLTPSYVHWAQLKIGPIIEQSLQQRAQGIPEGQVDDVAEAIHVKLQTLTNILFSYIQTSRFDLVVNEAYSNLIVGTAAIKLDEGTDDEPLMFSSVANAALSIEESPDGQIRTSWMDFELTPSQIMELWPDASLPTELTRESNECKVVNVIQGLIWQPETNNYYMYVCLKDKNIVLFDQEMESSPFIIFRWSRLPGDTWGRGIAHDALPTIKTLNRMIYDMFRATEISIAPPMLGFSDDVMNISNLVIQPNTIIPISRSSMGEAPLRPLELNPNVQLGQLSIQELQNWINKAFMANPIGQMDDPTKTATEIDFRERLLLEEIGPAFGRLQVEFFNPLIDRCLYILRKKGLIAPVEVDGKEVTIKYSSPLAKTQDQADLQSFSTAGQILSSIYGELTPLVYNTEKVVSFAADKAGAQRDLFKNEEELKDLEDTVKQLAAEAQQAQQMPVSPEDVSVPQQLPEATALQGQ